jgi:putative transposase
MSAVGTCADNAAAESFFGPLKRERVNRRQYRTRSETRADVFDYIEIFYNRTRRHSHLGGVSPETFETASNRGL